MANLLTIGRVLLIFAIIGVWAREGTVTWWWLDLLMVPLLAWAIFMDALDGWAARRWQEESESGALFDIAGDRVVELTLWVVAADLDLIPIWVPLVFIIRGVVVATIRSSNSSSRGLAPFALMQSGVGKFLVSSRFMRLWYAVIKAVAFCGLALLLPFPVVLPELWAQIGGWLVGITYTFVYLAVLICVVRGLPVIIEFVLSQKDDILGTTRLKR